MLPCKSIGVAHRMRSKRDRGTELLHDRRYSILAEQQWKELLRETGVSASYLRQTWLENPGAFPKWVSIRKRVISRAQAADY